MAVGNSEGGSKIYFGLHEGRFVRKYKQPIEGVTTTRTNKQGNEVHEQFFNFIEGTISRIEIRLPKPEYASYGPTCLVEIIDGEETYVVQIKLLSGYFINFIQKFLSSEIGKPIYLSAYAMPREDGAGNNYGIWAKQFGDKLGNCFTKEHGLPEWEKIDTDQGTQYSKKKQIFWLIQKTVLHCLDAQANILSFPQEDLYLNIQGYGALKALPEGLPYKGESPTHDNMKAIDKSVPVSQQSFPRATAENFVPPAGVVPPAPASYVSDDDDDLPF